MVDGWVLSQGHVNMGGLWKTFGGVSSLEALVCGLGDFVFFVGWGWMSDFGAAAFCLETSVGFLPVGWLSLRLGPVHQGCFVAPVEQAWHGLPMRSGEHEGFHGFFGGPDGAGPEREVCVAQ